MEYTVDLDLEDLESRLYSQIYYNNEELEETEANIIPDTTTVDNNIGKTYRYFLNSVRDNCNLVEEPQLLKPPSDNTEKVADSYLSVTQQTPIVIPPNFTVTYSGQNEIVQNNITVNQYSFPFVIHPETFFPSEPRKFTTRAQKKKHKEIAEKNKKANKKKKPRHRKLLQKQRINYQVIDEVICISDSDDCNVTEENMSSRKAKQINTKFPKKYNEADGDKIPEVDDDVIFIPPPPIEVINVDLNEQCLDQTDLVTENINEPDLVNSESNDFLETHIEPNNTDFNFALHGSDFNTSATEFRQPLNPVEYCETESSCSTNDHQGRDFSNTVKTIVFDEVDFPREDIFSENNLESFSSFITPKRTVNKCKEIVNISKEAGQLSENNHVSTDTSSSESDYETNCNTKTSKLPNLSLMELHDTTNKRLERSKSKKDKRLEKIIENDAKNKEQATNNLRRSGRIKGQSIGSENSDDARDVVDRDTPNFPKSKRKKNRLDNSISIPIDKNIIEVSSSLQSVETEDPCNIDIEPENLPEAENSKRKKKKRSSSSQSKEHEVITSTKTIEVTEEHNEETEKHIDNESSENVENLKKKKKTFSKNFYENPTDAEVLSSTQVKYFSEQINQISSQLIKSAEKLKKKKKNIENSSSENNSDEIIEQSVDKTPESVQVDIDNFIKNVEITTELSHKIDLPIGKQKKKKKHENSSVATIANSEITNTQYYLPLETNTKQNLEDNSKNKKKKSEQESTENNTSATQQEMQIEQIEVMPEPCTSTSDPKNILVTEIVDLDEHSNHSQIIVSSDSDSDVEVVEDTGNDLTINCSIDNINVSRADTSSLSQNEYERIVKTARATMEDFEKFDVTAIQSKQSDDPNKWMISYRDKATYLNFRGNRGPRCNRCRHFGHIGIKCPDKPHPPPCILCGEPNHQEPRCPFKVCTQCGHQGDYSTTYCYKCFKFRNVTCRLCKMVGHIENTCPDLWRRYRLTTNQDSMVTSLASAKPRIQQWCSGCAKQGHLEHECDYYNRHYPPTNPFINNYEDNLEYNKQVLLQQQTVAVHHTNISSNFNTPEPEVPSLDGSMHLSHSHVSPNVIDQIPSTSRSDVPNTLRKDSPSTSKNDVPNTFRNDSSSPFRRDSPSTFRKDSPNTFRKDSSNTFRKDSPSTSKNDVPNTFRNDSSSPFRRDSPSTFRKDSPSTSRNDDVIFDMRHNFDNNDNVQNNHSSTNNDNLELEDPRQIEKFIMTMPHYKVTEFLKDQVDALYRQPLHHPKVLKRRINRIHKLTNTHKKLPDRIVREKNHWYRLLNMLIFGTHKQKEGAFHIERLKKYLSQAFDTRLDGQKRTLLLNSYSYIFGCEKHVNVDYLKILRLLIRKYYSNNTNVP